MYINSYLIESLAKDNHAELLRKAKQRKAYQLDNQQRTNSLRNWLVQRWNTWQQRQVRRQQPARPWVLPSELAKIKQIG